MYANESEIVGKAYLPASRLAFHFVDGVGDSIRELTGLAARDVVVGFQFEVVDKHDTGTEVDAYVAVAPRIRVFFYVLVADEEGKLRTAEDE